MAHDIADIRVAMARIEERIVGISDGVDELTDWIDRVEQLEAKVNAVRSWSMGAAAATMTVASVLAWLASHML